MNCPGSETYMYPTNFGGCPQAGWNKYYINPGRTRSNLLFWLMSLALIFTWIIAIAALIAFAYFQQQSEEDEIALGNQDNDSTEIAVYVLLAIVIIMLPLIWLLLIISNWRTRGSLRALEHNFVIADRNYQKCLNAKKNIYIQ